MAKPASALPPLLAAIAEAAGPEAAAEIARAYGGTRVVTPRGPGDNWLTELVGREAAAVVIEALGPARRIDVPLAAEGSHAGLRRHLRRRFAELDAEGASEARMARELGVTGRTVRNWRARLRRRDTRQAELFE